MYEFRYDYNENKYDHKSKQLSTDTDISMHEITEDLYGDFSSNKEILDFSN